MMKKAMEFCLVLLVGVAIVAAGLMLVGSSSGCATTSGEYVDMKPNMAVPFSWEANQCHSYMVVETPQHADPKLACPRFFAAMRRGDYVGAAKIVEDGDFAGEGFQDMPQHKWFEDVLKQEHNRLVKEGGPDSDSAKKFRELFHADWLLRYVPAVVTPDVGKSAIETP